MFQQSTLLHYDPLLLQLALFTFIEYKRKIFIPVTLSVDGFLISGELVSAIEYYQGIAALMPEDNLKKLFEEKAEEAATKAEEISKKTQEATFNPAAEPILQILYLRDAHILSSTMSAVSGSGNGLWWRCRLSAVTGFNWNSVVLDGAPEEC